MTHFGSVEPNDKAKGSEKTPAEQKPAEPADSLPATAVEETVVVHATEPGTVTSPIVATPAAETTATTPIVHAPVLVETTDLEEQLGTATAAEPILLAGSPADEVPTSQSWWQSRTAILLVCVGALTPFSSRRRVSRDESEKSLVGLRKRDE